MSVVFACTADWSRSGYCGSGTLVEAPEGDARAVGAPAEAVAQAELLFVDPVARAVDDHIAAVVRERALLAGGEVHHEEIVVAHEGGARAVGGELREHLEAGALAHRAHLLRGEVHHRVESLRVRAPDAHRVVEEERLRAVGGERESPRCAMGGRRSRRSDAASTSTVVLPVVASTRTMSSPPAAFGRIVTQRLPSGSQAISGIGSPAKAFAAEDRVDAQLRRGRLLGGEGEGERRATRIARTALRMRAPACWWKRLEVYAWAADAARRRPAGTPLPADPERVILTIHAYLRPRSPRRRRTRRVLRGLHLEGPGR